MAQTNSIVDSGSVCRPSSGAEMERALILPSAAIDAMTAKTAMMSSSVLIRQSRQPVAPMNSPARMVRALIRDGNVTDVLTAPTEPTNLTACVHPCLLQDASTISLHVTTVRVSTRDRNVTVGRIVVTDRTNVIALSQRSRLHEPVPSTSSPAKMALALISDGSVTELMTAATSPTNSTALLSRPARPQPRQRVPTISSRVATVHVLTTDKSVMDGQIAATDLTSITAKAT
jgi:hypothetical protein